MAGLYLGHTLGNGNSCGPCPAEWQKGRGRFDFFLLLTKLLLSSALGSHPDYMGERLGSLDGL